MKKKVVLTGAGGFIGRHTIEYMLEKGYRVHAVDNTAHPDLNYKDKIFWHSCDLMDANQQKSLLNEVRPTHLLHFAWVTIPGKYWTSPDNFRWVTASLNLLSNFGSYGGHRVILAGTCAEYDWSYGYCSETITPTRPSTLYGVCKNSLQEMSEHLCKQNSLSRAWGRIFFLYGPHEHPSRLVPSVINSLLRRKIAHCSHGKQIRDFLYVKDAARAFVDLLDSEITGPINIASGQPVFLKDFILEITKKLKKEKLIKFDKKPLQEEPPLVVGDIRRLRDEVGFKLKYTLENGLDETIQYWRNLIKNK